VKIVDNQTVEVKLKEANSEFLAECTVAILPKSNAEPDKKPIGTGPFQIDKFIPGQSLEVKRFEGYRDSKYPYLDKVTFKIIPDANSAFTQLQSGSLDILQYLTSDQAKTLGSKFNVVDGSINYVQALFLNNDYGPLKNVKVRQALCYAVDRDEINQFIFGGKSHIIGTNMIPNIKKYYNADTETVYKKDIDKAKSLLKEAGYANGFDLTITVPNNYPPHQTTAEVIVEDLKKIGIRAKVNLIEFTSWVSDCYNKRNYQATVVAVDGTLAPSSWFAKNVSNGVNNFTNYKNSKFDQLFKEAKATTSEQDKIAKYKEMQMILANDAASVYIQDAVNMIAVNKRLAGYTCYPVAAQDMSKVGLRVDY
jgi:peptide/nickel transport system substrate-binding protein